MDDEVSEEAEDLFAEAEVEHDSEDDDVFVWSRLFTLYTPLYYCNQST